MIDADEVLRYEDGIDIAKEKQNMTHDLYNINCKFGSIEYARTSITKNNMPYYYKGVVHEFLECHDPIKTREMFKGVYNVPLQDSARNESNQKFQNDIKLLEDELILPNHIEIAKKKKKQSIGITKEQNKDFGIKKFIFHCIKSPNLKNNLNIPETT